MKERPSFPATGAIAPKSQPVALKAGVKSTPTAAVVRKAAPKEGYSPIQAAGEWAVAHQRRLMERLQADPHVDQRVAHAMGRIPRHRFVDSALAAQAYEDTSLPIGLGQTISKPSIVARMLSLMLTKGPQPLGRVLEIGSGCGYQATVMSQLAKEVYSIERLKQLHEKARSNVRTLLVPNLHLILGDGMLGFPSGAPYDVIVSAAGGDLIPDTWVAQLAVGGCIIAPTVVSDEAGRAQGQALVVLEKSLNGVKKSVFEPVQFVPLKSGVA
jgi:protein-L-isoaspartate(D-aspartate) O-methyltransferase